MKITKEYSCNTTEIPVSKMTRTFNALKRMNWVQHKTNDSLFAGIAPSKIRAFSNSRAYPNARTYAQYMVVANDEKHAIEIQNNHSTTWTLEFETYDEYRDWFNAHLHKLARTQFT